MWLCKCRIKLDILSACDNPREYVKIVRARANERDRETDRERERERQTETETEMISY